MKSVKFVKSFVDDPIMDVFVAENRQTDDVLSAQQIFQAILSAEEKICLVAENGITDEMARTFSSTDIHARKYIIVPAMTEERYGRLKDVAIIHEVPNIKGNYLLIDGRRIVMFDENMNGTEVADSEGVEVIQRLFIKEFWENATYEYINSKIPVADITFDIPPIYGNDKTLLDESFKEQTDVEDLVDNGNVFGFINKVDVAHQDRTLFIKDAKPNAEFFAATNNEKIFLAEQLPVPFVSRDGRNSFCLNFDAAKYHQLPEKGQGRLFAIKNNKMGFGKMYRFHKHMNIGDLIDADVRRCDGTQLTVAAEADELRSIDVDLLMEREYVRMEKDPETLEARLVKKFPDIFDTDLYAGEITYIISLKLRKHKIQKKAAVYGVFAELQSGIERKLSETRVAAEKNKNHKVLNALKTFDASVNSISRYKKVVNELNRIIFELNEGVQKSEVDESLLDVKDNKKKVHVQSIVEKTVNMELPQFGTLYQDRDTYEYVLNNTDDLQKAIDEMVGIKNISYLAE